MSTTPRPDWRTDALCAEVVGDIFFPPKGASANPARSICAKCTVVSECLTEALRDDRQLGIRGGLTERERMRILREVAGLPTMKGAA